MAVIEHQGFGKSVKAEFRCVVGSAAAEGIARGEAGDVDDEATAAEDESSQGLVRAVERAVEVEIDVEVPFFGAYHLPS